MAFGLAILGYAATAVVLAWGFGSGRFAIPGGDVSIFLAAGERLRAAEAIYVGPWGSAFYFAPPLVVLFAGASVLPGAVVWLALVLLDIAGLRYLAGSWMRVGLLGLCPITAFQLASGNPNFAIVAAILAAHRGWVGPLALAALAKLGPVLALPSRDARTFALVLGLAVAITLPWLHLWPEWVRFLLDTPKDRGWPIIVPLLYRLPVIVVLLALRRPWAQMLAAALAIPGFYIVTAWATLILAVRLAEMEEDPRPVRGRGSSSIGGALWERLGRLPEVVDQELGGASIRGLVDGQTDPRRHHAIGCLGVDPRPGDPVEARVPR